jgi:hypothetical protein
MCRNYKPLPNIYLYIRSSFLHHPRRYHTPVRRLSLCYSLAPPHIIYFIKMGPTGQVLQFFGHNETMYIIY